VEQRIERAGEHTDKLANKYIGEDKYRPQSPGAKRVVLVFAPDRTLGANMPVIRKP
jgi:hypothetical protein